MNKKIPTTLLLVVFSIFSTEAEPGGTYILTGKEKGVAEIVKADMKQYPELYQGVSLNDYISKFKRENRIGKRKLTPGNQLRFPETLAAIKEKNSSAETNANSKEESSELVIEADGPLGALSAWLVYGGVRSLWRDKKFAETYPSAKQYRYTFAEEFEAKSSMIRVWKEMNEVSSTASASDPYLDDLVHIEKSGLLKEYIWQTDRTEEWEKPKDLKLEEYDEWKQKNIPNHKPQSKVEIK